MFDMDTSQVCFFSGTIRIQSISGPFFPTFKLIYSVNIRIKPEYRKKGTRKLRIRIIFTQCNSESNIIIQKR